MGQGKGLEAGKLEWGKWGSGKRSEIKGILTGPPGLMATLIPVSGLLSFFLPLRWRKYTVRFT